MPFEFYVVQPIFSINNKLENQAKGAKGDFFQVCVNIIASKKLKNETLLLEMLKAFAQADCQAEFSAVLQQIQSKYKALLSEKASMKVITETLLEAYTQVVPLQVKENYDTQISQIEYIKTIYKRFSIMTLSAISLAQSFYVEASFQKLRCEFLLALTEDARIQLHNVCYGLYYGHFTQNFKELKSIFKSVYEFSESIFEHTDERVQLKNINSTELYLLRPIFEGIIQNQRYAAAFYFSLGKDEIANQMLARNNVEKHKKIESIFSMMEPNQSQYYNAFCKRCRDNHEGFNLDNAFNQHRILCASVLKNIENLGARVPQKSITDQILQERLFLYLKQLLTFETLTSVSCLGFNEGISLLRIMWLGQHGEKDYSNEALAIIYRLLKIITSGPMNIMLAIAEQYLLEYNENMALRISRRSKLLPEKTPEKTEVCLASVEELEKELAILKISVTDAQTNLKKNTNQAKAVKEYIKAENNREKKCKEAISKLEKEQEQLKSQLESMATASCSLKSSDKLEGIQTQTQTQMYTYQQEIADLKNHHKKEIEKTQQLNQDKYAVQQAEKERLAVELKEIQDKNTVMNQVLQSVDARYAKRLSKIKHKKESQKQSVNQLKTEQAVIAKENDMLNEQLQMLEKSALERQEMHNAQYQLALAQQIACQIQVDKVSNRIIKTLDTALHSKEERLAPGEIAVKVFGPVLVVSENLQGHLVSNPFLAAELLGLSLQLQKPFLSQDYAILRQGIANLLLSTRIDPYLAVFGAIVNHEFAAFSFKIAYEYHILVDLIPLAWPLVDDPIIQSWLVFVNMKLAIQGPAVDPYYLINLILIAPYYVLLQKREAKIAPDQIIENLTHQFIKHFHHLNDDDKILLKNNIKNLSTIITEFQDWMRPPQALCVKTLRIR